MSEDPPRLLDSDAGSELARALRVAKADVLTDDAVARVRAGVLAQSAAAATGATAATAPEVATDVAQKASSFGLLAKAGVALVVVGAGLGVYGLTRTEPVVAPTPAVSTAIVAHPPPLAAQEPEPARTADLPEAPPTAPRTALTMLPRTPPRPAPQPSGDAVIREGAILLEARRVLDADPAKALALVKKCEADFPDSQLAPERTRIAAQARQRLEK